MMEEEKDARVKQVTSKTALGYFGEYCENTSIHGVHYVNEKRSLFEKFLWALLVCTSLSACGYLISHIYNKYRMSPVIVTFATKESPIYTIPFPAVTICPMVKADKDIFNFTYAVQQKWDNISLSAEQEMYGTYMSLVCNAATESFVKNQTFTNDFYDKLNELRMPLEKLFAECKYMNELVDCSSIFTPIILDESVCYSFNILDRNDIFRDNVFQYSDFHKTQPNEWDLDFGSSLENNASLYPIRAYLAGYDNSLEVTLMQKDCDLDFICVEDIQGYSVSLHLPSSIPMLKRQYFQVPLDNAVLAVLQPNVITTSQSVKKFKPVDRECYFSKEKPLQYFKFYNPENCRFECLTNHTLTTCGCVQFYMPRVNSTPICGGAKLDCVKKAERQLKFEILFNSMDEFACDCKPLCTDIIYDIEQSQTEWNYKEQFRAHRINMVNKTHFSKLSVFFKRESFLTSQRNQLYGPIDFLANFGGLLGLFTGFSLLSLAEIIYFSTVRICCNVKLYNNWKGI